VDRIGCCSTEGSEERNLSGEATEEVKASAQRHCDQQ
jgi:hypothetical protein